MQFLPDVDVPCPECGGSRYGKEAWQICYENKQGERYSLPQRMEMDVNTAQRLKLASEMGRGQSDSAFIFDEPTIGLHPLDVQTLLGVFQTLVDNGATVIVIEHDLNVIRNADYIIDMGPGGGEQGGRVVACGTPEQIAQNGDSITGSFFYTSLRHCTG